MVVFYADLPIHSRFSRATSSDADLEHMALWARRKGISVLGTGDFTHPAWLREIEEKLVPAEPGLFRLRPELEAEIDRRVGAAGEPVRFLLEVEISTIYKKGERTRKVHHLIYVPDLEKARKLIESLSRIGNLASDGRPILGLDSRHLLEIALESGEGSYLVPAHIWTPWFAALGSKSGFDSIEECYGDLSSEIFAVETGLSSDPEMNWRISALDRYRLVSNSDAHSPPKIAREACAFDVPLDYFAMRDALRTGEGFRGTVEFFPEEGKYHLDGHRNCGISMTPEETRSKGGTCPACGKPVTLGVMHRVSELADRGEAKPPPGAAPFRSLVPLDEVLSEIHGVGPASKAVRASFEALLARLGSELFILERAPLEDLGRAGSSLLSEALGRMREGRVIRQAGFDGQYGTIRLFETGEIDRRAGVKFLFDFMEEAVGARPNGKGRGEEIAADRPAPIASRPPGADGPGAETLGAAGAAPPSTPPPRGLDLDGLDPDQALAARIVEGPLCIIAGPGTGKTRTLTQRIAHLISGCGAAPGECLAVTFTRRAAGEMRERLERLLPGRAGGVAVTTFHALGLSMLREHAAEAGLPGPVRIASEAERLEALREAADVSDRRARQLLERISRRKREGAPLGLLESRPDLVAEYRARYRHVSVDEFQDIDALQYRLLRLLAPPGGNVCVIGDPDQSIYGFRGAEAGSFARFLADFSPARTVRLTRNYRSTRTIVEASLQLVAPASALPDRSLTATREGPDLVEIHGCPSERAEAEFIVETIERAVGGSSFFSLDSGRSDGQERGAHSFGDFAVLYRAEAQAEPIVEALSRSGIPFQKRSHRRLGDLPWVEEVVRGLEAVPLGAEARSRRRSPRPPRRVRLPSHAARIEGARVPGGVHRRMRGRPPAAALRPQRR